MVGDAEGAGLLPWVAHEHWANRRQLDALDPQARVGRPGALLAHVLAAQSIWLARLDGRDPSSMPVWPDPHDTGLFDELDDLHEGLRRWAIRADGRLCSYRTSRGVAHRTPRIEIVRHVLSHGAYHRGQIAAELRASGLEPPSVDYIAFVREGGR